MTTIPLLKWQPMFDDRAAKLHDLPAELLAAHRAVERLTAELAPTDADRPDVAAVERRCVDDFRAAALASNAWPDVTRIREARTAADDHDLRRQVLDRAQARAAGDVLDLIHDHADTIVTDYLRPVHDRLVTAFEAAAKVIPEAPTTDALMRAPDKVRKAWLSLDDTTAQHARLVSTAARLGRLNPVEHDTSSEFASLRNLKDIWPEFQVGRTPPWDSPDLRLTRLAIIRAGGQMWLPTSAERDAAWWARYGGQVEQTTRNRFALQGFAAFGGSA